MFMETKQIHSDFCSFSAYWGNPADLECHDIVLKGIVWILLFFSFHLLGGERSYVTADVFIKSLQTGIKLRESTSFAYLFFCS